ncbi:MAG: heavy metal translocating P-type ATPase, partial [Candidatus Aminicenantales bacterium]
MAMSQGHDTPPSHDAHEPTGHPAGGHGQHLGDLKKRFWISLAASLPVLALSPMVQGFLGLGSSLRFPGDSVVLFIVSSFVYFYGGRPFLEGLRNELKSRRPGMMTLI